MNETPGNNESTSQQHGQVDFSEAPTRIEISVIVVVKNEEKCVSDCLESLVTQDLSPGKFEIIVVDGGSTDKTQQIVRDYPVVLIVDENGSIAHGRNLGLLASKGKLAAFIDADCIAERSWLRKLVENIEKCSNDVCAVGGPNLIFDNDPSLSKVIGYMQETFFGSGGSPQSYNIKSPHHVVSIANCNVLYRKEILSLEKYDDALNVGEDCDLNFRLTQEGYKFLYVPDIVVWHHRPNSVGQLVRKMFVYGEAMAKIVRKHKRIVRWYSVLPSAFILALVFAYPTILFFSQAAYVYGFLAVGYLLALIAATAQVYMNYRSSSSLMTLPLLPLQHLSYGFGFFKGILRSKIAGSGNK